ncbi:hypothetical protein DPMN_029778 [Dreissena polymorpha]|uniref:Uncharacterized protein n=1 Tax=Dreissena polymorpha TaxID=45954 RepID=A0A9D4LZP2_DREPO|nr:hypothetical protein DPMN_029778 [Dreissena polymorpha]
MASSGLMRVQTPPGFIASSLDYCAGQVEALGGNHTREALQGLLRRGLATITTVKMNMYSALSTCTALTVGWQHNVCLQEKQKPLSFIDKVRLMRQVRPSMHMSPTDMKAWKEALSSIFHVKQTDLEDNANEECSNTSEGLLMKYSKVVDELQMMKDKCSKLETENSELRRQLTERLLFYLKTDCSKSKENSSKETEIEAFWRFEDGREEWLPAKLIRKYANGECSVQYSDGVSRVRSSWVREVGQM